MQWLRFHCCLSINKSARSMFRIPHCRISGIEYGWMHGWNVKALLKQQPVWISMPSSHFLLQWLESFSYLAVAQKTFLTCCTFSSKSVLHLFVQKTLLTWNMSWKCRAVLSEISQNFCGKKFQTSEQSRIEIPCQNLSEFTDSNSLIYKITL